MDSAIPRNGADARLREEAEPELNNNDTTSRGGLAGITARFSRSMRVQIAALLLVFAVPPVLLYSVFRDAEVEKQSLLVEAVRENGRTVGRGLAPMLQSMQPGDFSRIPKELARFESDQRSIKVLFKPEGGAGFFYVASAPVVTNEQLAEERQRLVDLGILTRLEGSCSGNVSLGDRVELPHGGEILMSVTPVQSDKGCWAVVVAANQNAVSAIIDGRPYWTRPETRMAAMTYATMALLVLLIFAAVWSNLARFRRTAANVEQGKSFVATTAISEFALVGKEFDAMVARLRRATEMLRQAAEDNAHAFKAPIAVMRQATELVAKNVNAAGSVGIGAITASLNRLEGLVRSAQRLDTATADLLETGWARVNLSDLVTAFVDDYRVMLGPRNAAITAQIMPGLAVMGREDMIDTVLENLIDNAISFSPPGGKVDVKATAENGDVVVAVGDQGPGVPPDQLIRIFDRYYSSRPSADDGDSEDTSMHFGIGLWLVRQHVHALGGTVTAENRPGGGLLMTVRMPKATGN
jgi:two-component system sensor histidine kinase ChvG